MENREILREKFEKVNDVCDEKRKIVEKTEKEDDLESYLSSLGELTIIADELLDEKTRNFE